MRQRRRVNQVIALSSAFAVAFGALTLPLVGAAHGQAASEPVPRVANAAPPASADAADAKGGKDADADKGDGLAAGLRKHMASVGMLLLLFAAAPGNLARRIDNTIQTTDFGKSKQAADTPGKAKLAPRSSESFGRP